ncbi:MAG: cobalamin-dependent protein [Pseudomonadota bacterium]|nr:cobalamin-dependent protein [Pseudomonadota bacterium]MBU1568916.1 cobalamin-dependent protein [Pseudomonadota bacterium]
MEVPGPFRLCDPAKIWSFKEYVAKQVEGFRSGAPVSILPLLIMTLRVYGERNCLSSGDHGQMQEKLEKIVKATLDLDLPQGRKIISEGRKIAADLRIGRSAFMDRWGVNSEAAYKRRCMRDGIIMFHAHIGMSTWADTAAALVRLQASADKNNFVVDRFGLCLDRRMGLPEAIREKAPAETGPSLHTEADWIQIGRTVPIQPHMGDFMIGFPNAVENTIKALHAGVTTIGNLSQYFTHEVPMWKDSVYTCIETVRAISIMGGLRQKGTLVHSYLEDGTCALFHDCATVAGWAMLERYIVEDLLGAKLSHCIGGLTSDPIKRAGWIFALDKIHAHRCIGSMFYGDTISFTSNFTRNRGVTGEYLLWDILAQLECPTGHAVLPLPVSEALRVPSAEEIIEAQEFGRRIEETARRMHPHVDFSEPRAFAGEIVSAGKRVYDSAMEGLEAAGADTGDPLQMLYILKSMGASEFEQAFGAGQPNDSELRGKSIVRLTDVYELTRRAIARHRPIFQQAKIKTRLQNRCFLIASTDVHEFAITIIDRLLSETGARLVNLGAECDPAEIAEKACLQDVDAILVSTHNGMALEYSLRLKEHLEQHKKSIPVIIGGVLNQKVKGLELPVDVTGEIQKIGFLPCSKLSFRFPALLTFKSKTDTE